MKYKDLTSVRYLLSRLKEHTYLLLEFLMLGIVGQTTVQVHCVMKEGLGSTRQN